MVGTKDTDDRVKEMTENIEAASRQVATWSEGKLLGARATMSSRSLASYYESPETQDSALSR
jgi:hypothetical protein